MQFRDLKQQYQVLKKDIDAAMIEVATNCNFIHGQQVKDLEKKLETILVLVEGAGETRVLLSLETGEQTVFQADETASTQADRQEKKTTTVTVTDASRQQQGLVRQVEAPTYRGAVVVCRGGDDPRVKLSVVEAVSGVTGLPSNQITVLKMK